jgi:hypothetical protein
VINIVKEKSKYIKSFEKEKHREELTKKKREESAKFITNLFNELRKEKREKLEK